MTAEEGVLAGTVRRAVLDSAAALHIPVRLAAPQVADAAAWQAAMISSTSRLLMPVHRIIVHRDGGGATETISLPPIPAVVQRLVEHVQQSVEARSEPL